MGAEGPWASVLATVFAQVREQLVAIDGFQPELGANASSEGGLGHLRSMLALVMVKTPPQKYEWRELIRSTLRELTAGVKVAGYAVRVIVRFAVGQPPQPRARAELRREARARGDLALLNVTDGVTERGDEGKIWHIFDWAVRHHPKAALIFKQDDDTVVDWRRALPLLLGRILRSRPAALALHGLYVGRLCPWSLCAMETQPWNNCANGQLYGFSRDVALWAVRNNVPSEGPDDMVACAWARGFEARFGPLDPRGLIFPPAHNHAWIHPVKTRELYLKCYHDRVHGCSVKFPEVNVHPMDPEQRFKLRGPPP